MLSFQEIHNKYKDSFTGTISISDLVLILRDDDYLFYRCPCESSDHCATRAIDEKNPIGDGFASVLHCVDGNKWMILIEIADSENVIKVNNTIRKEEEKYLQFLEKSKEKIEQYIRKNRIDTITAEDLFILHATRGYDPTVVEGVVGCIPSAIHDEYLLLMEEHRRISRKPRKIDLHAIVEKNK